MNRIFLIAVRELKENVRTKAFWIGILIFPILLTAMIVVPTLLERAKGARTYVVVDQSGWLMRAVERQEWISDLTVALSEAASKAESGNVDDLPAVLHEAGRALTGRTEYAPIVATLLVEGGQPPAAMPPEVSAMLDSREELAFWVRNLSVDDARAVSSRMSRARYLRIDLPDASFDELNQMLINDGIFAYFVIGEDPLTSAEGSRYVSRNLTDDDLKDWFSRNATAVVRSRRLAQENISPQIASWIQQPVRFEARRIGDTGREEDVRDEDQLKQWAPVAFLYLLWISVFTSSQMLLTNTIEEKSNRIMEVLLSSVSPLQLMVGKIAGIAGSGLILIGSWILMFYVGTKYLPGILGASPTLDLSVLASDPKYILAFGFYYLFGYLLYASLLVAIGSVVNTLKEAQNLMGPITLLLMVPLIAMIPIGKDPNGTLAQVMSYIPPFTPFVMMNRAAGPPSTFEYVSTTVLLIVSVLVAMWAAAKIFRIGILMTGKAPKFREILRWLRAPVGAVPEAAE